MQRVPSNPREISSQLVSPLSRVYVPFLPLPLLYPPHPLRLKHFFFTKVEGVVSLCLLLLPRFSLYKTRKGEEEEEPISCCHQRRPPPLSPFNFLLLFCSHIWIWVCKEEEVKRNTFPLLCFPTFSLSPLGVATHRQVTEILPPYLFRHFLLYNLFFFRRKKS